MMTVATLVVRSSTRQTTQASATVARERAMVAAHAAVDLAAAHYRKNIFASAEPDPTILTNALQGSHPPSDPRLCKRDLSADAPDLDCIPGMGTGVPMTGQRNHLLGNKTTDCAGRPCMRPGAVVVLPNAARDDVAWTRVPMAELVENGDPDALVTVWMRNNSAEALGAGGTGSWVADEDYRIVLTAMATIRNTSVAIEQEYYFKPAGEATPLVPPTPDEGYGGGHHGDNTAVAVCKENYATADLSSD